MTIGIVQNTIRRSISVLYKYSYLFNIFQHFTTVPYRLIIQLQWFVIATLDSLRHILRLMYIYIYIVILLRVRKKGWSMHKCKGS